MEKLEKYKLSVLILPEMVFYANIDVPFIFTDPQVKDMIRDCIKNDHPIGISMAEPIQSVTKDHETHHAPRQICGVGMPILLSDTAEGLKVLLRGISRAKLLRVEQHLPYPVYIAEEYPDVREDLENPRVRYTFEELRRIFNIWVNATITNGIDRETFCNNVKSTSGIVDYLCYFLIKDREIRQLFLENTSLTERAILLNSLFDEKSDLKENLMTEKMFKIYEYIEKFAPTAN